MSETKKNFLFAAICGVTAILLFYGGMRLQIALKMRDIEPAPVVER